MKKSLTTKINTFYEKSVSNQKLFMKRPYAHVKIKKLSVIKTGFCKIVITCFIIDVHRGSGVIFSLLTKGEPKW